MPTRKWGLESQVNTTLGGPQHNSKIAALTEGRFVVVWQDDSSGNAAIRAQIFDSAGKPVGGEFPIADVAGNNYILPDVTALADGSFYVTATEQHAVDNYIVGSVWDANGVVVRFQPVAFAFGQDTYSKVAQLGSGSVVTWYDPESVGNNTVFRIFDADGNGASILNTTLGATNRAPFIATSIDGSRFVIASNYPDGYGRLFNANGSQTQIQKFPVGTDLVWLDNRYLASVAVDAIMQTSPDQTTAGYSLSVTVLDTDGTYWNGIPEVAPYPFTVPVTKTIVAFWNDLDSHNEKITALPNGQFVVSWEVHGGAGGDGSGSAIAFQAFDSSASKIGGQILVNTSTSLNQVSPSLAALSDGRVAVSWTDFSSGNADVRMQIIDPRDGIVNGTFDADTLYGHDSAGDDISGFDGSDTIYGLAGADSIVGGNGNDLIFGGRGDDTSHGGNNNDRIYGDFGDDEQFGDAGADLIYSGVGSDLMDGGAGSDTAYYSSEKVAAIINLVDQSLNAGSALGDILMNFELIFGSSTAADSITGGGASETILGNGGADFLNGGGGGDTLRGGTGADTLNGGAGADKFQFTALNDVGDNITNYEAVDDFQFTRAAFGNLAGANVAAINFLSVASGHAATTTNHRFIFDQATDQLWFDGDGSTNTISAVMVADLSNNINITNLDLLLF